MNNYSSKITKDNMYLKNKIFELNLSIEKEHEVIENILFIENKEDLRINKNLHINISEKVLYIINDIYQYNKKNMNIFILTKDINFIDSKIKEIIKENKNSINILSKLFILKEEELRQKILLESLYKKEKDIRQKIHNQIYSNLNIEDLKDFSELRYFSKEFLFQKKDKKHFDLWVNSINKININKKIKNDYLNVVNELKENISKIKINKESIKLELNNIRTVSDNKRIYSTKILEKIDLIFSSFVLKMQNITILLILLLILIIIVSSFKTIKLININQQEIEK